MLTQSGVAPPAARPGAAVPLASLLVPAPALTVPRPSLLEPAPGLRLTLSGHLDPVSASPDTEVTQHRLLEECRRYLLSICLIRTNL